MRPLFSSDRIIWDEHLLVLFSQILLFLPMFLYSFSLYAGQDRIFYYEDKNLKNKSGSLLHNDDWYFLVLWEEVSFPELYTTKYQSSSPFTEIEKNFISWATLQLVHRMVYQRYSSYKTVIKLFLNTDIPQVLSKKPSKTTKKRQKSEIRVGNYHITDEKGQILVIFPDLWTLKNAIHHSENALFLNTHDTQSKKDTNRWKIKQGQENLLISTSAEIFQDFKDLSAIYLIEPQKRYYASQQDPRYKVQSVAEKLASLHQASLHIINSEELSFNTSS